MVCISVFSDLQGSGQDKLTVDLIISTQTDQKNLASLRFNSEGFQITGLSLQPSTVKTSDRTLDIVRRGPTRTFMSKNSWQKFNS